MTVGAQEKIEREALQRKEEEKAAKIKAEFEEKERKKKEEDQARQRELAKKFKSLIESGVVPDDDILYDEKGIRWAKCSNCGKIKPTDDFSMYGIGGKNIGFCSDCVHNNPEILDVKIPEIKVEEKPKKETDICPGCGGKLKYRSGRYGKFWGCSNYPRCTYTRK